jgi:hypothetical protein
MSDRRHEQPTQTTIERSDPQSVPSPQSPQENGMGDRTLPVSSLTIFNAEDGVVCTGDSCFVPGIVPAKEG